MTKITNNSKVALGIGLLAIIYLQEALTLPFGSAGMPDIGFVPVLEAFVLLFGCLFLILLEQFFGDSVNGQIGDNTAENNDKVSADMNYKKTAVLTLALFIYLFLLKPVGFLPATIGLLFVCFRVMEYGKWYWSLGVSIIIVGIVNIIFTKWLGVFFPQGLLS